MATKKKSKISIDDKETRNEDGFIVLETVPGKELVLDKKGCPVFKKAKVKDAEEEFADGTSESEYFTSKVSVVNAGNYVHDTGIITAANMNIGRSIPWVEDGLKFVERRILYTMHAAGWTATKPRVKTSAVIGRMAETVYPHGIDAPANTIYRLNREFQAMIPCIDIKGSSGDVVEPEGAAARYTEARLSKYAMDCFFNEEDGTVPVYDMKEAYTKVNMEPVYLATRFPNVLLQWNQGIGKGASTIIAAFNSIDVFEATLKLMDDPKAKINIYPDTQTPIEIINKDELEHCFDKSQFHIKMRSPYKVDTLDAVDKATGKRYKKHVLIFTSCPFQTSGDNIKKQIFGVQKTDLERPAGKKKLPEVLSVYASTMNKDPNKLMLIVEYEKGYDPHALAEKLYSSTSLACTIPANFRLCYDYRPKLYTPREVLLEWIKYRLDQKRRYFTQKKKQASHEKQVALALITILKDKKNGGMDGCIKIIRDSKDEEEAKMRLRTVFELTELQATTIVRIRLGTLTKANLKQEEDRYQKACDEYIKYRNLCHESEIRESIKEDLRYGLKTYGRKRRAIFVDDKKSSADKDEKKIIVYNKNVFYCLKSYDELVNISKNIDSSFDTIKVHNGDGLLLFNAEGQMKVLDGYAFNYTLTGIDIKQLAFDNVVSIANINDITTQKLAFITKHGYGKTMSYSDFSKSTKGKVIALNDDDELVSVIPVSKDGIVGMVDSDTLYYVKVSDIPDLKRSAFGNRLVKLKTKPNITRAMFADKSYERILIYGESGYIKILDTAFLSFTKRGPNCVSMKGKTIYGVVMLSGKKDKMKLYYSKGISKMELTIDGKATFSSEDGLKKSFPMSTSIGNPVKLLSMAKYEFYKIV